LATTEKPSVNIRPIGLNRPSPFRARLKERQKQRLERLRNKRINLNKNRESKEEETAEAISIPNFPSIPGGNAPIFVSSQRQTISPNRRPKVQEVKLDSITVDANTALKKERARERIKALFSRKRQLFGRPAPGSEAAQSRRKRQQLGEKSLFSLFL